MYRLLIVDDEEIIVNGLYEILRGVKELELDVYKAYSGEEAIEWLNRTRIDVVLTDICMPELDGLQLLEEIRSCWPQCRVIFLSGHSEFEYVYQAIQHPGISYILKTEDHEKVIQTVLNTFEEIKKEIRTEDLIHQAKNQMNMALELFQKDYFLHLLHGDSTAGVDEAQFDQLSVPLRAGHPVMLVLGGADAFPEGLSYSEKIQQLFSVRQVIARYMATHVNNLIVMDENYRFVLLLQPKESAESRRDLAAQDFRRLLAFLRGTLEAVQLACRNTLHIPVSFALSEQECDWKAVSGKYSALNQLLSYRIGSETEALLSDGEFHNHIRNEESFIDDRETTDQAEAMRDLLQKNDGLRLERLLESGQRDAYFETLQTVSGLLRAVTSRNNSLAVELYYSVSLPLLSYINRWRLTEKLAFFTGQGKLMRTELFASWREATDYLWELSHILFELQAKEQKKRADNTVVYLQSHIESHLGEDLSLVRLAELVFLNPSYLSRMYKQETGANLSDFIEEMRMKKARELLLDDQTKINEIARLVGYESAASFTRFFKKSLNLSPQEYRSLHLSRKQV